MPETGTFDAVVMNMVLINVDTIDEIGRIFKEIYRVLKSDGLLIFSDLHPIMKMTVKHADRNQKYLQGFSYFKDGSQFIAGIKFGDGKIIEFTDRHWTLETYTKLLQDSNLYISLIAEPTYAEDATGILKEYKIPEYILFMCKKVK